MDNIQAGGEQCVSIVGRLSTLQSSHSILLLCTTV